MSDLPTMRGNNFYLDYLSGENSARDFITHGPMDFAEAIKARGEFTYPRRAVSGLLSNYNNSLGAGKLALDNCKLIEHDNTYCVITGQQVGFMGGPLYSLYKIITAIRLAEHLQENYEGNFIPVFWGATEDHDFHEINHVHHIKNDGELGKISFKWNEIGKPVSDLELNQSITEAYNEYLDLIKPGDGNVDDVFVHGAHTNYADWKMSIWSKMFSGRGLVVVTPELLRGEATSFFQQAHKSHAAIRTLLDDTGEALLENGYSASLAAPEYGSLYTFNDGYRIRVAEHDVSSAEIEADPNKFSTDAALRPLLADMLLPTCASVLGPGEVSYQAMLKPVYQLFNIPQPVLFPRLSYTVVEANDHRVLDKYHTDIFHAVSGYPVQSLFEQIIPDVLNHSDTVLSIEPLVLPAGLSPKGIIHLRNEHRIKYEIALKKESKKHAFYIKKAMKEKGFTKGEVQRLRNRLFPKNGMQERMLPMTHFLAIYGKGFIVSFFENGQLFDFCHNILYLED